jgi:tetratricopeptide (TPR) repeat protein
VYDQSGSRKNADMIYRSALRYKLDVLDLEQIAAFYGPDESPAILDAYRARYPSESLSDLVSAIKRGYKPMAADTPQKGFALSLLKISNSVVGAGDGDLYDTAFLYANQALAIWPELYAANLVRAKIFYASNRGADFLSEVAKVPEGHWLFNAARLMRADYYMSRGETGRALEAYGEAIEADPAILTPYLALGRHYFAKGEHREAVRILSRGAAAGRGGATKAYIFYLRSLAYEQRRDLGNALSDLERATALAPDEPSFLNSYGYFLVDRNIDVDKGTRLIERALRTDRDNPNFVDSYGWAMFKQGNLGDAALLLQYAKLLNPTNAVICDHLASVYWTQGRESEARFEWNKALHYYKDSDKFENLTPRMIEERLKNGYDAGKNVGG